MPAGAGTARYENGGLVAGIVCLSFLPPPATHASPWIPAFRRNDEVGGGERRGVAGWPRAFSWLGTSTSATCFSLDCRKSMLGGRSLAQRVGDGIHLPSYQWLARLVPLSLNGSR